MTDQDPTQRYEAPPPPPDVQPPVPPALPGPEPATPSPALAEPVATTAVSVPAASRPRRSLLKWAVALVVVVLVAGSAAAATALLTGDSGTPEVASWTPSDSITYGELRLDLPGSQQAELAKVLSAFPGFDDQAAFPTKLHEALDQLVGKASDGKQSYTADIEPWFGGQVAYSIGDLPSGTMPKPADVRALVLASTKDAAKAGAWAASVLQEAGVTGTTETYNGVTITKVSPTPNDAPAMAGVEAAYATYGSVLGLGDLASVKASIDTQGKTGIDSNAQFKTASDSLSGDRLAFVYQDTSALVEAGRAAAGDAPTLGMPTIPSFLYDLVPPWTASAVRAENGAIVLESRQPHVDKMGPAKTAESTLPSLVPPETLVLVDAHDTGAALQQFKTLLETDPEIADGLKQVDQALNLVGGFNAAVGWMGETGIAISKSGDAVGGGIVVVPTDPAAAKQLFTQLRSFVQLGGAQAGLTITDETYGDATISVMDLGALAGMAGASGVPVPGDLKVAWSVTDEVVVLGYGVDFVKGVLDARSGPSLAETDRFKDALGRVDKVNASLFWIDIAGARSLAEPLIPAEYQDEYTSEVKPYLDPFETFIATSVPGDELNAGKAVITVAGQ